MIRLNYLYIDEFNNTYYIKGNIGDKHHWLSDIIKN